MSFAVKRQKRNLALSPLKRTDYLLYLGIKESLQEGGVDFDLRRDLSISRKIGKEIR